MSEQATNSPQPHEQAVANIENMFREKEGIPAQDQGKRRNPDGTFAAETADVEQQGTEQVEPAEGQEPAEGAQPQSEEVEVEFDVGGAKKSYRIPKEISDRFIQHADYTRKTQDIAELRRVTSAEREASNLERAFAQSVAQERDQIYLLDAQIAQFKHVNWAGIEDTGQLIKLREQLNQLKDTRAGVAQAIQAKRGEFDERIKGVTQEAVQAGIKYIQQHIKGYDEKMQHSLHEYGRGEGYSQEELRRVIDPRIIVTLWKASQWDALKSSNPQVLKRAASAAPAIRPGATQKPVSRLQQTAQAIKKATTPKGKQSAAEDYFAAKFGER